MTEPNDSGRVKVRSGRERHPFAEVFAALDRSAAFARLRDHWQTARAGALDLSGAAGSLAACALAKLYRQSPRPTLVLLADPESANHWHDDLTHLVGDDQVTRFHAWEILPYEFRHPGPEAVGRRLETLWRCLSSPAPLVVTHLRAALEPTIPPDELRQRIVELSVNAEYPLEQLIARLVDLGYRRAPLVEEVGSFSVRGGIVDLFTYTESEPIRLEFLGDAIESIRTFAVGSQRTTARRERCVVLPSREVSAAGAAYDDGWAQSKLEDGWRERLESDPDRPGLEWLAGSIGQKRARLFDYFADNTIIWSHDPERLQPVYDRLMDEAAKFHERLRNHLADPPSPDEVYGSESAWKSPEHLRSRVWMHDLYVRRDDGPAPVDFDSAAPPSVGASVKRLAEELSEFARRATEVAIACDNEGQKRRMADLLEDLQSHVEFIYPALHGGFVLPQARFALLTEHEIFNRHRLRHRRRHFQEGLALSSYTQLKKGDYVVHVDHGIARFRGLESITVDGRRRDCLFLLYQDDDKLFVPIEEFDRVQKYSGKEGKPTLSKLGGTVWERTKARAKTALLAMAEELIVLYAARKSQPGFAFSTDGEWMTQMEGAFIYEETPDQATAIEAVARDMQTSAPMDRLVCGDVGYGKTEVAIRAAFRAVCDHKQVAILVPTTILAQQHLSTFRERLSEFPVRIETLSRFRSPKEQKRVVDEMAVGKIDIVIGTHRLLQKDIGFSDLGLLIIDEEQRFGVAHKEKLRKLRQTVDTLALSATPIPRTLQMSLLGARDLSMINTSPRDRLPVQTEIRSFDPDVISEAVLRELDRGGQVYFVHNRVQSIGAMAELLRRLLPTVKIAVAHGQMAEGELESVMVKFYHNEFHVLLSTAIIESGLDLPSVNTIIIHRADRFGLAQMYQLRGRVGRSARQAYAYLLVPPAGGLSPTAKARLRAIEEHTALGSGFHLAMRDLEIRGAGNLLGPQQHGFIEEVGFDLYCRLLDEAVAQARGTDPVLPRPPVQIEAEGDRFIPDNYITDNQQRFEMYKRLAELSDPAGVDDLGLELTDRFGTPPDEVRRLLQLAKARVWARLGRVARAVARQNLWTVVFAPDAPVDRRRIEDWRASLGERAAFVSGPPFQIGVRAPLGQSADLAGLIAMLETVAGGRKGAPAATGTIPLVTGLGPLPNKR
ncbi:MAG: transcription-repair coupling factor [candidate division Zixibacteria bacterium]|nr:transcription-repair coupling factor [candidate division Zixibacteria bacterium]